MRLAHHGAERFYSSLNGLRLDTGVVNPEPLCGPQSQDQCAIRRAKHVSARCSPMGLSEPRQMSDC